MFSAFIMFCYAIGTVLRRSFNDNYPITFIVSLLDVIGGLVIVSLLLFIMKLFNSFYNEQILVNLIIHYIQRKDHNN